MASPLPTVIDYSTIKSLHISFQNTAMSFHYSDDAQLFTEFFDDNGIDLDKNLHAHLVENVKICLETNTLGDYRRIPLLQQNMFYKYQCPKTNAFKGLRTDEHLQQAFKDAIEANRTSLHVVVMTDSLFFLPTFSGANLDHISPKTVVIAPPPFPLDPAALLPTGCDGSRFQVPHVVDDDDDDDDDDARASLDLVHDPPHPTSSVVCPPSVVLSDGVHDPPNPTSSVICPPSVVLSDGPFLPLASAATNLHGPPLAPVELQIHQLGTDEYGNGPPSYSGGGADYYYPPRDSYDDGNPPPPSAEDPRGDHRNYYKNNSYPESSRRQSNHYPESSGQQSNYYSDTDYNPPSDSYDDYTPPSADSHGDGKYPSSYTDDGRGEADDARYSDDHSSYPDDEHSYYSYDPDEPPGETY
jgi:hypothetical protein